MVDMARRRSLYAPDCPNCKTDHGVFEMEIIGHPECFNCYYCGIPFRTAWDAKKGQAVVFPIIGEDLERTLNRWIDTGLEQRQRKNDDECRTSARPVLGTLQPITRRERAGGDEDNEYDV